MDLQPHIAAIIGAIVLAAVGGELFLKSVLGIAEALRVPKLLVATSLAAFATSSPELTVSTVAALAGKPEIGLGDALGSNVVNIALVLGLALLFGPIRAPNREFGRDYALALFLPALTFLFIADSLISRAEGSILLLIFGVWMGMLIGAGMSARESGLPIVARADLPQQRPSPWRLALPSVLGLVALVLAGRLFVSGAGSIAAAFGVDTYVIGASIVAVGTSLPELVTVLLARLRNHDDIGIGTLLGSNLFNGLAIVGVSASIHPIRVTPGEVGVALAMGTISLLLMNPRQESIPRVRSLLLLITYGGFIALTMNYGYTGTV